jgi:hypothetical protein
MRLSVLTNCVKAKEKIMAEQGRIKRPVAKATDAKK